ncbi:MAG: FCD domain-containing protein, partial [Clostridia bacterium]
FRGLMPPFPAISQAIPPFHIISPLTNMACSPSEVRSGLVTCAALGIVQTHARAGSFLSPLDNSKIADIFSLLIKFWMDCSSPAIMDIYQLKTMLDAELFPLAATYRTPEELIELRQILDEQAANIDDTRKFIEMDEAFHFKVACISRNNLASVLVGELQAMLRADRLNNQGAAQSRPDVLKDHRELFDAISRKDVEHIAELARQHSLRRVKALSTLARA